MRSSQPGWQQLPARACTRHCVMHYRRSTNYSRSQLFAKAHGSHLYKKMQDAAAPSAEASGKWRRRRVAEVRGGKRQVPHGMSVMLAEAFRWGQ